MVNLPLASDRLALRLVGFTTEDAGYIDNVLVGQPRRHVRQRGQRREGRQQHPDDRRARGAAVRHFGERGPHPRRDLPGHPRRRAQRRDAGRGRPQAGALREREPRRRVVPALADVQRLAVVRRPGRRGFLLRPQVRVRGRCDRLRSVAQQLSGHERLLRRLQLRRGPARLRHEPRGHGDLDARGPPAVEERCRKPLVLARGRVLQQGGRPHGVRQLHPRLRGHAVVRLLQRLRAEPDRQHDSRD